MERNSHAANAVREVYHTPQYGRWSTPAAPSFDAVGMPKRHTYKPQASPLHYADQAIAADCKIAAKSRKSATKLHAKVAAKSAAHSRPVRLIRADGTAIAATFKHPDAIRADAHVIKRADLSKATDQRLATITNTVALPASAIVQYPALATATPVLTAPAVEPTVKIYANVRADLAGITLDRAGFTADRIPVAIADNRLALSHVPNRAKK